MSSKSIPRVCILNIAGYPLYSPKCKGPFGGMEVQCYLLAKGLAKTGKFDVSVIVSDHGQPSLEIYDDVKVYPHSGYRGLGILGKSPPALLRWWLRRLKRAFILRLQKKKNWYIGDFSISASRLAVYDELDAQVYIARWNTTQAAELAFYCSKHNKKFVFLAASGADFSLEKKRELALESVIESADLIIAQTESQSRLLEVNYGRTATVIPSLVDAEIYFPRERTTQTILWVGKTDSNKRVELVLELAKALPQYRFEIVANSTPGDGSKQVKRIAQTLPNVSLLERVPYQEIELHFAQAKLFVNTSIKEGFPNTFLQAAKYGVPILSYEVDPGGILSRQHCGVVCGGSLEVLKNYIEMFMKSRHLYDEFSRDCKNYVQDQHMTPCILHMYTELLLDVLES